ncbi:hypothetical protein [Bradyrhizobium sp. STM 3809]|uniref:hypothetical protein n=1 Tax=Bradyrhizobium sp. STM 3809 TaxID=551936 RepID=UPI000240974E|nr:hypothetical protein [Bradyrhizobium sp. STM 3809]CCE00855.1 conserved exported hypothetical protein [Bradyrhizobium sp. STM 3809]
MRTQTVAWVLGIAAALSATALTGARAEARPSHHRPLRVVIAGPPAVRQDPYWVPDYYIVPRYRYRPQDDRVDTSPYAPPVAPGDVEPGSLGIGQ